MTWRTSDEDQTAGILLCGGGGEKHLRRGARAARGAAADLAPDRAARGRTRRAALPARQQGHYPVEPTPDMAKMVLEQGVDMVVGDRLSSTYFTENKRPFHNFGNSLVRKSINSLFKSDVKDIMTGLRAFSYGFVKTFPVISKGFEIETEMTIHAIDKNMFIKNVVVDYRDRVEGSVSKLNTFSDGFKVIKTIIRLFKDYKPLRFFTTIALVLFVLALIFFVPVMGTYVNTGLVPNFPTLIVCGFVVIAALQCFFTGLTLSTIVAKNRQDFEFKRITVEEDLKDKLNK